MTWNIQALTRGCVATAQKLGALSALHEFYLAGGTALALWFGHRVSVDLDFFSERNPLGFAERQTLQTALRRVGIRLEEEREGTLQARDKNTHLSFFYYRYPLLRPRRQWKGLQLAHPVDIALMKVGAIIGRGSQKDFFDLYVVLHKGFTLTQLLRLARKKFKDTHDIILQAYRALVYFQDADQEPLPKMLLPIPWPRVKEFFETEVRKNTPALRRWK
ncbi:MAG: nucleotidyl transferase AbiEii/AbiGii toxin family protein [Elusimicrobia bacterium]|nr:nucleotidyl transferase AbiEii/AbiGii toxin family protein [Elusimicrobiota bacterium]